jgi:hypothetical protein
VAKSASVPKSVNDFPTVAAARQRYEQCQAAVNQLEPEFHRVNDDHNQALTGTATAARVGGRLVRKLSKVRDELYAAREDMAAAREELDAALSTAGQQLTENRRPEYTAIVKRAKAGITEMAAALADERAFRERLEADGGSMGNGILRPMALALDFTGWLTDARQYYGL